MSRVKQGRRWDPIEQAMELALRLGDFIGYGASWELVSRLEEIERDVAQLLSAEPARAIDLYETFVAGCYEKAEEIDDSSASFGMFVQDLFCGKLLTKLGRNSEALESAWSELEKYPSRLAYDQLMKYIPKQAKRCYRKAALDAAWDELAGEIRRNHRHKSSFMPGFERLVQGKKPDATPTFRDRTQRRKGSWTRRGRSEKDVDAKDA